MENTCQIRISRGSIPHLKSAIAHPLRGIFRSQRRRHNSNTQYLRELLAFYYSWCRQQRGKSHLAFATWYSAPFLAGVQYLETLGSVLSDHTRRLESFSDARSSTPRMRNESQVAQRVAWVLARVNRSGVCWVCRPVRGCIPHQRPA